MSSDRYRPRRRHALIQRYKLIGLVTLGVAGVTLAADLPALTTSVQVLGATALLFVVLPFALFHVSRQDWFHPLAFPTVYMGFVLAAPILFVVIRDEPIGLFGRDDVFESVIVGVTVSLVATIAGTVFGISRDGKWGEPERALRYSRIHEVSLMLLAGVVAVHLYAFVTRDPSLTYGQNQLEYDGVTSLTIFANLIALPAVALSAVASAALRGRVLFGSALILTAVLIVVPTLQGDRSQALSIIILLTWAQHTLVRPIKLRSIVVGTALLLFAIVTVANVRTGGELPSDGWEVFEQTIAHVSSPVAITADLINLVPREHGFEYGQTYVSTLKYLPPGPVARAVFGPPDTAAFVYRDIIEFGNQNLGFGFSLISEAYLNFGWYGLVFIPAGFGVFLGWAYRRSSSSPTRAIHMLYPMLLALLPYLYRSDSLTQVKLLAYAMVTVAIVFRLNSIGSSQLAHAHRRVAESSPDQA